MADEVHTGHKRPTIYDVARQAGVSHMTVSRVLNGAPNIKDDTRARVQAAITDLNFRPSATARILATSRTRRIGVLVDSASEHGPSSTLLALERAARGGGYSISTYTHGGATGDDLESGIAELERLGIDALCIIGPRVSTVSSVRARTMEVPVVVAGVDVGADGWAVDVNQAGGATSATQHLLDLGHRVIIHLTGPLDSAAGRARELACQRAASRVGALVRVVVGDWSSECGHALGMDAELIGDATAVFAANDQMALGVIHGLWSRSVRVPDDISVVGFDDVPGAAHFLPPLTTVRADLDSVGAQLFAAVRGAIEGHPLATPHLPAELVIRGSTAAPSSSFTPE